MRCRRSQYAPEAHSPHLSNQVNTTMYASMILEDPRGSRAQQPQEQVHSPHPPTTSNPKLLPSPACAHGCPVTRCLITFAQDFTTCCTVRCGGDGSDGGNTVAAMAAATATTADDIYQKLFKQDRGERPWRVDRGEQRSRVCCVASRPVASRVSASCFATACCHWLVEVSDLH